MDLAFNNQPFGSFTRRRMGVGGRKLAMEIAPEDQMAFRLLLQANQGFGMAGIKCWLQQRFPSIELLNASEQFHTNSKQSAIHKVITPDSVPEFVVPVRPRLSKSASLGSSIVGGTLNSSGYDHECTKKTSSATPVTQEKSSNTKRPMRRIPTLSVENSSLEEYQEDINSYPGSLAAHRFHHLKTVSNYGCTTAAETPHTRRRESLLMSSLSMDGHGRQTKYSQRCGNASLTKQLSLPCPTVSPRHSLITGDPSLNTSLTSLTSDRSANHLTPNSSPKLQCPSGRLYNRRRSSLPSQKEDFSDTSELSSANDYQSHKSLTKEEAKVLATLGELKLSLVYNRQMRQLKLVLIKAENLCTESIDSSKVNTFIKVRLMPSKQQQQSTSVIKGTHNPTYNTAIVFNDVKPNVLQEQVLRIRLCNKPNLSSRKSDDVGEVYLPLEPLNIQLGDEVRMWRDLEPKSKQQQSGCMNIIVRFEPKEDRMLITVVEAKGLPKSTLHGNPDPYVKIKVKQDGRKEIIKHTKTCKGTTHPVFQETFVFSISPKLEDLRYTSVVFKIYNREIFRADNAIGGLRLGSSAVTEREYNHWANVIRYANSDISEWHALSGLLSSSE